MSSDNVEMREIREENGELQDEEQFEKSDEFENQGFEYGVPLDDNPEHAYSEGHPEAQAATEEEPEQEPEELRKKDAVNPPSEERLPG